MLAYNMEEIATPTIEFDPERAADIKRRILLDVKTAGRRLGVDQMRIRYGHEGIAAETVITEMAAKGLLLRETDAGGLPAPEPERREGGRPGTPKDELVHAVSELEYRFEEEVRKGLNAAFSGRREARRARHAERRASKSPEGRWERKLPESSFRSKAESLQDFEEYAQRVRKEARSAKASFIGHLIPFIAVNAGLMALNAAVSPSFPWAVFPFGGWAIGLLEHYASVLRRGERARELGKMPPLDPDRLELFKKLQKKKDSIWLHLASTISTTGFLAAVNLIVSPQFLWFLFPAVGMGIGLVSHSAAYAAGKSELEAELLDSLGLSSPSSRTKAPPVDFGPYRPLVDEARALRLAIAEFVPVGKIKKRKGKVVSDSIVDEDLLPTVDSYVEQVALLAKRTYEADRIMELIPADALNADKEAVLVKLKGTPGEGLRREYEKTLSELEKQETSYAELKDQRELLELRLRSSVMTLKQLRIDLARLSGMPSGGEEAAVSALRDKTAELNRYLSDLRAGYAELDALEFRALEKTKGTDSER